MDAISYSRFIAVLILVLGLIFGLAWVLKRAGFGNSARGPLGRRRRLRVVETATLDARHRVVLLRRDDVEHLVLIGANTSQVIERGIVAPPPEPTVSGLETPTFLGALSQIMSKDKAP